MQTIPIQAAANQTLTVQLDGQLCQIDIRDSFFGLEVTLYVNNTVIIAGVLALNLVRIVRDTYLGFSGDLYFVDTQGSDNPTYDELGSRFLLIYCTADELE